jgi:hypothetical protein
MSAVSVRPPAVAGLFYPASPASLTTQVDELLAAAQVEASTGPAPKAIIAPHAGYQYSGPIAAAAYVRLKPARGTIRRVVLIGPAHRVLFRGVALPSVASFRTPLGDVPIDHETIAALRRLPAIVVSDDAHRAEHSLEVHLPFLQRVLGDFALVPLAVGDASGADVAAVLDAVWGGPETVIVISSDLSHYHDYRTARGIDAATAAAVEQLDGEALDGERACGYLPIQGLLQQAVRRRLSISRIDLRNSGDTAGPRTEVVGYGAWAVG